MKNLADIILKTAAEIPAQGRYLGGEKVYICAVQKAMPVFIDMVTFKEILVSLHRSGHIRLSRIDVPRFGDLDQIAQSETCHLESVYHTIIAQ